MARSKQRFRKRKIAAVIVCVTVTIIAFIATGYFLNQNKEILWRKMSINKPGMMDSGIGNNPNESYDDSAGKAIEHLRTNIAKRNNKLITYSVVVKGSPQSSLDEFKRMAAETFSDSRGWTRAGVAFQEVTSGGDFILILSEAQYLPSYAPNICTIYYSCSIGSNVIINNDRWTNASDSWNAAGGSLRDYRHMVINHEVGHFLGHPDNQPVCAGPGQLAPLMQQQSIDLRGCIFNPWPLDVELWVKF